MYLSILTLNLICSKQNKRKNWKERGGWRKKWWGGSTNNQRWALLKIQKDKGSELNACCDVLLGMTDLLLCHMIWRLKGLQFSTFSNVISESLSTLSVPLFLLHSPTHIYVSVSQFLLYLLSLSKFQRLIYRNLWLCTFSFFQLFTSLVFPLSLPMWMEAIWILCS